MKANVGTADKVVRILMALVIGALYFTHKISGTTAVVLLILAGIFIVTPKELDFKNFDVRHIRF